MATTVERVPKRWRLHLAYYLPAILIFVYCALTWSQSDLRSGLVWRLVGPVVAGLLIQVGLMLAYVVAVVGVARVAGVEPELDFGLARAGRVAAAVLLAASVWVLGQHWRNKEVDEVAQCVGEQSRMETNRWAPEELVRWCASVGGSEDHHSGDDN
jgi:hypothetical protein